MKINKILIVLLILFLGVGCVSASEDISSYNGTDVLSLDDTGLSTEGALSTNDINSNEGALSTNDINSNEGALSTNDINSNEGALSSEDSLSSEKISSNANSPSNEYDLSGEEILKDDEPIFDFDNESNSPDYWDDIDYEYLREHYPELFNDSSSNLPWLDLSCGNASEIITSNITQYDFNDAYRVKVVDEKGKPVFTGKVDFYLNHKLVGTSLLDFSGIAYLDLSSCINVSDSYDIVSIYSDENDTNSIIANQNIYVNDLQMKDRDIQIYSENIKLYDLGELYRVKVVDKEGNPVTNGHVIFIIYDRVIYCNISESGIASCALPLDLNFTGNLLVWSIYSDGNLYDLAIPEQISIGTRTLASLDSDSLGSLMLTRWNKYDFVYNDGKYVARIGGPTSDYYIDNEIVYLVRELSGETYTLREVNISSDRGLSFIFSTDTDRHDVVIINLAGNTTYDLGELDITRYSDQEWDYIGRISYGQWIINGNGAAIKGGHDINFLFIGSEANVNFIDTNITNFDHCFINHGNLMCKDCIFDNNEAYKTDVKLWGSGAVVHNYNTVYFDQCYFTDNDAKFNAITVDHMGASILYAEPYSVNIFKDIYGKLYADSFYCEPYSTTIIYDHCEVVSDLLSDSEIAVDAYFTTADYYSFYSGQTWEVNVTNTQELTNVFWVLNTYINASEVIINMAPGTYNFNTDDYENFRYYNWRKNAYNDVKDRYMLDVGLCPVTINGNGAVIHVEGNDNNDDYHFAFIGQYGSLTLNNVELQNFNTAIYVTGSVVANHSTFRDNVIDYRVYDGDVGGVFRSYGGSIVCHNCRFIDNGGDDDTDDFYAELSSYVEFKNCSSPEGRMKDSYLKCTLEDKKNINLKGDSIFENAFEEGFEEIGFITFNVSDDKTYNAIFDYLKNHTVNSILINFTGNYNFNMSSQFERSMSVIFQNNGYDVNFNQMEIKKSNSFTFINFNFNNVKIVNKGTATFINCSIFNKDGGDYALKNEGSCTLISCRIFDNFCDDEIIWNTGHLTVLNSTFWNDNSNDDDGFKYGIIYNDGGSVKLMNTGIDSSDYDIYNFNSGNCAIADNNNRVYNLEFDEPWSNFKKGMIKGAFMLGTTLFSYGAGAIIGIAVPTVAGVIGATVAGTLFGLGGGIAYSVLEGQAYHDYSNMWKNILSFTMLGFSMGRAGFELGSAFSNRLEHAMNQDPNLDVGDNPQAVPGGEGSQGAQGGPGGDGHISLNDGYQNSPIRNILDQGIEDMLFSLKPIQNIYPNVYGQYVDTYAIMASNPQITVMEMMNLYNALYTANSAIRYLFNQNNQQLESTNQQTNPVYNQVINQIQIVDRVNNINFNLDENIPIVEEHYVNPFVGINAEEAALVHNPMDRRNYLENFIRGNAYLSYLNEFLTVNTYYTAMSNISHTNRALTLLYNFAVLSENVEYAGQSFLTNELVNNMRFYRRTLGRVGVPRIINALFDPRAGVLEGYERIYQAHVDAFNERLDQTGIREIFESNQSFNLRTVIEFNTVRLINDLDSRISHNSRYYDEFIALKGVYYENYATVNLGDIDLLWNLLNRLKKINESLELVDPVEYNNMVNFNYVDSIKDNVYNGIFNNPNIIKSLDLAQVDTFLINEMEMLKEINATLYNIILSKYFNKEQFDNIEKEDVKHQIENLYATEDAVRAYLDSMSIINENEFKSNIAKTYMEIQTNLSNYRTSDINQLGVLLLYILSTSEGNGYRYYSTLSDSEKLMVNKYLYDQCIELNKTFNGVHYMFGIEDYSEDLIQLQNIKDTSPQYFRRLLEIYHILTCSRDIDSLFNTNISNLNAKQISDLIIRDLAKFYQVTADIGIKLSPDLHHSLLVHNLAKVIYWGETGSKDKLTDMYNRLSYYSGQYSIFFKLEYNLYHLLPNDWKLLNNFTWWELRRPKWGNDGYLKLQINYAPDDENPADNMLTSSHKGAAIYRLGNRADLPDMFKSYLEKFPNRKDDILHNIFPLLAYNQFLKLNVSQLNISFIDLFLEVLSNYFIINNEYNAEYYNNITEAMPDKDTVIEGESHVSPAKERQFPAIDVSNLSKRLNLFEETCPVGYYILMDSVYQDYNYRLITQTMWKYNNTLREFCIRNNQGEILPYYEFCNRIIDQMKHIMDSLGVVNGDKIIFKNVNFTFSRLFDMANPYNNIFNKYNFYYDFYVKELEEKEDEEFDFYENSIINELKHDLIYLKNINETLYKSIMMAYFDNEESFDSWYAYQDLDFDELLYKYASIVEMLKEYREDDELVENEINVIINQLTNDTINYLSEETEQKVRSYLLYYIFFWELYHNRDTNTYFNEEFPHNPKIGNLPFDLLDKPLKDIYKRYTEILNHVTYHIFNEDIDFASLSIDEMRNVLINNLYRAYNAPNRFNIVFDFLNERNIHFDNFLEYENYINSLSNKDELIELYDSIRKIIPSRKDVNPNPNQEQENPNPNQGPVNPNPNVERPFSLEELNKMKAIILDEHSYPDEHHIYIDITSHPECYFKGAWNKFAHDYPKISAMVNTNLFKGDMDQFIEDNNNNYGTVRNLIVNYLQQLYGDVPAENPNPGQDSDAIPFTVEQLTAARNTLNQQSGQYGDFYFEELWHSVMEQLHQEISKYIVDHLMGGNLHDFAFAHMYDYPVGIVDEYLANMTRDIENSNQGQVNPNPNPNPEVPPIQINEDIFNEIVEVMQNEEIPEPNSIYEDEDDPLRYIMGSWVTLRDKYSVLFRYIEERAFNNNFFKYAGEHKNTARNDVIEIARKILNGEALKPNPQPVHPNPQPVHPNPEPANPEEDVMSNEDFNEIRKILLNESVYPKKVHYVISDSLTRLYGSWDLIEEKYPEVALKVRNGLFKSYDDLFLYAFFTGDSSVGYRDVRQRIIEYIEKNCYDGEEIAINDDPLKINGKDVSDCTVDEVYTYLVNQIIIRNWDEEDYAKVGQTLLDYADSTYFAYIQFMDLMAKSGVSESSYKPNIDQFKNKFLDMLKTLNSQSAHLEKSILNEIEKIINKKTLIYNGPAIIDNPDKDFLSLLGSWQSFETKYPQIAGIVFESEFGDDMLNIYNKYKSLGADGVRERIIEFVKGIDLKLYPNIGIDSSSNQNPNAYLPVEDKFYIPQHNVAGTTVDDIIGFMDEAVEQAKLHVERIRFRDESLATSLRIQIDKLYADYLVYVKSYNHQYQYTQFIQALNELFKGLNSANYVDPNAPLKKLIIKKDNTDNFNRQKFIASMQKSLKTANDFANEVAKNNKILADRIRKSAEVLYNNIMDKVNNGGNRKLYYEEFVNGLNKLFLDHINANTVHERKESESISKMTNEQILAKITTFMSQPLSYPKKIKDRYAEIKKLKEPNRNDLVDLYNDINNMISALNYDTIRLDALKGKYTFFDSNNYPMKFTLKEYKKQMGMELYRIRESLPNLHYSIKKSYDINLSKINSLDELKVLRQKLNAFCNNYLQFHKIDKKWYADLSKEFGERNAFSNILKTYFDIKGPELGFTKNLSLASSNTIKEYINKEMEWLMDNNRDLYNYYLVDLFGDAESVDSYFDKLETGVPPEQMDAVYQNLYRNIQERIQPVRDLLHEISLYYYESAKSDAYIKSITDAFYIKFNDKKGGFTKVLINAIRNINSYTIKYNLTEILIESGINPIDGSITPETKDKLKNEILKMFSINREIKDEEFEFLVDIMDFNLNSKMRSLLLADYVKIINNYYNEKDKQHEDFCEYQRIRFEVLRYQALTVQKIQLYEEELAILNNLESLKCYDALNYFFELKLKYNRFKNIANFAMKNAVKNSIEYTIVSKGLDADIANLEHVNVYYSVFNKKNDLPNDFEGMVNLIQKDMQTLQGKDFVLFSEIRDKYFEGHNNIGNYLNAKYDNTQVNVLKNIYNNIYRYLGSWRDNQLVATIELLPQG